MIIGIIHKGSGLGDQLFSYIATRVIALDKGYDFGFVGKEFFKGKDFLNLDWGKEAGYTYHIEEPSGKLIPHLELIDKYTTVVLNKPYYDPEVNFIEDGMFIDGYGAQDIRYFGHRLDEVREWLKVKPKEMYDRVCVINFRGGEFATVPELFLPREYWDKAIEMMGDKYFEVHTDDVELARQFFPKFTIYQDIDINWRSLLFAKHAIISNSAFAIIPRLLNGGDTIAPRYWARRNIKEWSMPSNYYPKFTYL